MGEYAERRSGAGAGRTVAEVLADLQSEHGFSLLHGVLLGKETPTGLETAHLDHVVVDPLGILIVEVMTPRRAVITGRYTDRTWSARYPEGRTEVLANPIRENDHRVGLVHELLTGAGWGLSLDHVRGIAVFVDCDTSQLELDSVNAGRVCGVEALADRYQTRAGFATSQPIPADQVGRLAHAIAQLDRSGDSVPASAQVLPSGGRPDEAAPESHLGPLRASRGGKMREALLLGAGLVALLLIAFAAVGVLRTLSREQPRGSGSAPLDAPAGAERVPGTSVAPAVEESAETKVKPNIPLAKKRLQQTLPERYEQVTDLDHPEIDDRVEGQITYRWEYIAKSASNAISVGTVSVTLDSAGAVIGSD